MVIRVTEQYRNIAGQCLDKLVRAFFKTGKENKESVRKAWDRLRSLPYPKQLYFSEKYYDGRMPWQEG